MGTTNKFSGKNQVNLDLVVGIGKNTTHLKKLCDSRSESFFKQQIFAAQNMSQMSFPIKPTYSHLSCIQTNTHKIKLS